MQPGGFLTVPENTGLILCSDGVQLFKSSKQAFWPVLLTVTSLPPGIRMNAENIILAGVWQGPVKPPMNVILTPVLEKIRELNISGIPVLTPNGPKTVRACLLMAVFDLPARGIATNFVQFNGYYSCTYCLDAGEHTSHRHVFPPEADHEPRTTSSIEQCAMEAIESGHPVYGVKGNSVLSAYISIIDAVPVDYMHALLEGVSRRLLSTCLDSKNHACRFYLGGVTKEIDKRLYRIKPPQEFRRTPRSVTAMKQWKASEFRAWLLFYSLPVLSDLLPADYIYHLALLVSAIHILLGDAIKTADIDIAQEQLELFYKLAPQLYPAKICTANMHSLIHLSRFVHSWGPLWCYSCFGFESMNGHLRKYCHGTRNVLSQLIHNVRMHQTLPILSKRLANSANPQMAALIQSLAGTISTSSSGTEIKGRISHKKLNESVATALYSALFVNSIDPLPTLPVCERIRHNSTLYTTAAKEGNHKARDGSICVFTNHSTLHFGSIFQFCFCNGSLVAVIREFEQLEQTVFDNIRHPTHPELTISLCNPITDFVFCVKKLSLTNKMVAVPVSSIFQKCVHIPVKGVLFDYIITIPNMFEHH